MADDFEEVVSLSADPSIAERISSRSERFYVSIGAVCNDNCVLRMEEDRHGRYVNVKRYGWDETVPVGP